MRRVGKSGLAALAPGAAAAAALTVAVLLAYSSHAIARQERLDEALVDAVQADDVASATGALRSGANPNTRVSQHVGLSPRELLLRAVGLGGRGPQPGTGATVLHVAAAHVNLRVAEALLHAGANPNALDDEGQTPLTVLVERVFRRYDLGGDAPPDPPHCPLALALLKAGARADVRSKSGASALYRAALMGDVDLTRMLLEHGAPANETDWGFTPLKMAGDGGHREVVRLLRQAGATEAPH